MQKGDVVDVTNRESRWHFFRGVVTGVDGRQCGVDFGDAADVFMVDELALVENASMLMFDQDEFDKLLAKSLDK